jgi:hypothetical protein
MVAFLIGASFLGLACGDSAPEEAPADGAPATTTSPTPGGTAVVGVAAGSTTLLPPLAAAALDFDLSGLLYLALNYATWEDGGLVYHEAHPLALARGRLDPG